MQADFTFEDQGTIALLTPKSERAQVFVDSHIDPEATMFCDAVVIEHRYVGPILEHVAHHNLTVEVI